jgi:CheY-like chemotaxis protein
MELECEPVNPQTMFNEIAHLFSLQAAEKHLDFSVTISNDLPDCLVLDEVRIRQIMFNLIGNAVKFTDKGKVSVVVDKSTYPDDLSKIDLSIAVEDTGIGIPAKYHKEIFDAFKQTDGQSTKRYGGTGLGLSITKRLIEMMGGSIEVESEEEKGTKFTFFIPNVAIAKPESMDEKTTDAFNPDEVIFDPAKVLIVDDISSNRTLIKEFFRTTQLTSIEAENGLIAVELTKRFKPDVVLMDLRMPVMGGLEALKRIRADEEIGSIPIIALTASGMKEKQTRILSEGFNSFLRKPIHKSVLFQEFTHYLKYCSANDTRQKEQKKKPKVDIAINPETLSQIIKELNETFKPMWLSTKENLFFDDIDKFASELTKLGRKSRLRSLERYGNELKLHVQNFDVEKMNSVLDAFPELIERISAVDTNN